jgi:23S rRNA (uracil1939-C5)-methyltransferase
MPSDPLSLGAMPSVEVTVDDVAAGGDGIARADDGRIVFVRGAIPGDTVVVDVEQDRPRMLRGVVSAVVEPSRDRRSAPCPHVADGCGGCGWQHVDAAAQRRLKVRIAEEALRRIGHLEGTVGLGPSLPEVGHRTTVRALVHGGRAAFRAERSHGPVPVDRCMVAHPGIDELIAEGWFGDAAEVTMRIGAATGERLVLLDPSVPEDVDLPDDVRIVGSDDLAAGRRAWFHEVVAGRRFRISADSFFQTRTDGAEALVAAVRSAGEGHWGGGHLVDLYGGVGLFSVCLGEGMRITNVEASASATTDARHNLADRDATVVRVPAGRWRPSAADLVVADPPRAGLGPDVVQRIAATGADRVVLVSCDAASFGRDAALLAASDYQLRTTELIDLFPNTAHVELVSRFDRGPR